jgi:hypothetical protein
MFTKSKFPIEFSLFAVMTGAVSCFLVIVVAGSRQALSSADAKDPSGPSVAKPAAEAERSDEANKTAQAAGESAPVFVKEVPPGYRDWRLIGVSHEEGNLHSFAAILGNDVAIKAYREGKLPYPEGTIIAALHWRHVPSEENNKIFGRAQSFVPGAPTNVQFMIKDSKKYASTGGWGFGHFNGRDDKQGAGAVLQTCFPCHRLMKARDLVFTRYAP